MESTREDDKSSRNFHRIAIVPLLLRPTPLRRYKILKTIHEARMKEIVYIDALHEILEKVYREVNNNKKTERTQAQRHNNGKTNVRPVNIGIGFM